MQPNIVLLYPLTLYSPMFYDTIKEIAPPNPYKINLASNEKTIQPSTYILKEKKDELWILV